MNGATYIDRWPRLADEAGQLRTAYTQDMLHLNGAGYAAWVEELRPRVEAFVTRSDNLAC